jgi:hypothetical protein
MPLREVYNLIRQDNLMPHDDNIGTTETLQSWIMDKVNEWADYYEANYAKKFDEYNRIWRGQWAAEDKTRNSERSRIISPASQQAVESSVAEIEEATFGRGNWFDMRDDRLDPEKEDVVVIRDQLTEDFHKNKIRKAIAECLMIGAVYGTGIGEIVLEEMSVRIPGTEPILDGELSAVGVNVSKRTVVKLRPILPKNFRIDPVATSVDESIGVATDEYVPTHSVEKLQEEGVYLDVELHSPPSLDSKISPDPLLLNETSDKVRLVKWHGLVPRRLLNQEENVEGLEEVVRLVDDDNYDKDEGSYYVEAIVVIANEDTLLKAEENPHMMQDRSIIAFPWDVTPGIFYGRGIVEKGYNSQKALDAELRARIDALALTIHPMIGIDATKIPRGQNTDVRPGKNLITNGDPREALHPFNFGQVDQITFAQAAELQKMVQTATGAVDTVGSAGMSGERTGIQASMSAGALIKRHKRTLINFQDCFILPFVSKAAYRYMQYDPDRYPAVDYSFTVSSSLGIIAREYEVSQLVQLLQTMSPESPLYPVLIESIVDNMSLSNREELIAIMKRAQEQSPEEQEAAATALQIQQAFQASQTAALNGQAAESASRAEKILEEAHYVRAGAKSDRLKALSSFDEDDDREFKQRIQLADTMLTERNVAANEKRASNARNS